MQDQILEAAAFLRQMGFGRILTLALSFRERRGDWSESPPGFGLVWAAETMWARAHQFGNTFY